MAKLGKLLALSKSHYLAKTKQLMDYIEVTGAVVKNGEMKEGRFFINHEYISVLGANGTKANFYMSDGTVIYSDANLTDILKQIENAKLYG